LREFFDGEEATEHDLFKDCGPGVCGISQIGCSDDEQQIFSLRLGQWFTADSICRYAADLSSIMEAGQLFCFVSYLKLDFPFQVHKTFLSECTVGGCQRLCLPWRSSRSPLYAVFAFLIRV
jgi:hypothetical protein